MNRGREAGNPVAGAGRRTEQASIARRKRLAIAGRRANLLCRPSGHCQQNKSRQHRLKRNGIGGSQGNEAAAHGCGHEPFYPGTGRPVHAGPIADALKHWSAGAVATPEHPTKIAKPIKKPCSSGRGYKRRDRALAKGNADYLSRFWSHDHRPSGTKSAKLIASVPGP
jgi:hypothetical protein